MTLKNSVRRVDQQLRIAADEVREQNRGEETQDAAGDRWHAGEAQRELAQHDRQRDQQGTR